MRYDNKLGIKGNLNKLFNERNNHEAKITDNQTESSRLQANLDYVAMMSDIDIPTESEVQNNES